MCSGRASPLRGALWKCIPRSVPPRCSSITEHCDSAPVSPAAASSSGHHSREEEPLVLVTLQLDEVHPAMGVGTAQPQHCLTPACSRSTAVPPRAHQCRGGEAVAGGRNCPSNSSFVRGRARYASTSSSDPRRESHRTARGTRARAWRSRPDRTAGPATRRTRTRPHPVTSASTSARSRMR